MPVVKNTEEQSRKPLSAQAHVTEKTCASRDWFDITVSFAYDCMTKCASFFFQPIVEKQNKCELLSTLK